MARPRIEIDSSQFERLCAIQCTLKEIAGFFQCSEDTVERWCKREYGKGFAECYEKYSASGRISLRRNQFRLAEHSAAMAIFLGKQYLGQKDQQEFTVSNATVDESIKRMDEYFKRNSEDD